MNAPHSLVDRIDWKTASDEALEIFRDLLRIDTTNAPDRPGNETAAAVYLAELLQREGLEAEVLESAPGRGNVVCRIAGDGTGGDPILLSGHTDVVPADASKWTHPPFGGEIHDGWIWGRGTIDMKNMVAMEALAMILLKRQGVTPKRDVIFAGVADEEAGCEFGSLWLAEHHPDKVRAEYAISEIGGFTLHSGGRRFYPVQIAEKGICWLTVTAQGTAGHGSLPNRDNPLAKIGRAAELLATRRLPHHVTPVVERFVRKLADNQPVPNSFVLKGLLNQHLCGPILDRVFPDPGLVATFDAALHNTANPTILKAGLKINQVPGAASLRVDGRLLPGQSGADLIREIEGLIGPGFSYQIDREMPATETDGGDPIAQIIAGIIQRHDPEAIPIQNLIPGFTDAKAWSGLGMKCWGFSPVDLPPGTKFAAMFHGVDERIPVDGFRWGCKALFELVAALAL